MKNENYSIDFSVFDDKTRKEMFAACYVKAKRLGMSEEEAGDYAANSVRRECMREQLFRDAPLQNKSIKFLFMIPLIVFLVLIFLGFILKTNWLFYAPAILLMFLWVLMRWRSAFWAPILYWFAESGEDMTNWIEYFKSGKVNIKILINACYDFAQHSPMRVIMGGFAIYHLLFWGIFGLLAYLAWR